MTTVARTSGVAGAFPVTFSDLPVTTPTITIYSDALRTVVAVATASLTPTTNPLVWLASYPSTLAAGLYFLVVSAVYTAGQPAKNDSDDSLQLTSPQTTVNSGIVTLAEAKTHLNITGTRNDAELALYVESATAVIEDHVGAVAQRQVTETVHGNVLRTAPALTLDSVTVNGSPYLGSSDLNAEAGLLYYVPIGAVVTYTVGRSPIPAAIKLATLVVIARLWETQRGSQPLPVSGDEATSYIAQSGPDLPYRAQMLLAPYRRGPNLA